MEGEFSAFQTAWMEACSSIYSHARLRKALTKPGQGNHNPAYVTNGQVAEEKASASCHTSP